MDSQRGTREAGKDSLDSLRGTREAGKDSLGQLAKHQGGRKGSLGQPARHQGGRKEPFRQPGRHQGGKKGSIGQGTREAGKNHLESLGGTREAGKDQLGGTREACSTGWPIESRFWKGAGFCITFNTISMANGPVRGKSWGGLHDRLPSTRINWTACEAPRGHQGGRKKHLHSLGGTREAPERLVAQDCRSNLGLGRAPKFA